MLWALSGTGDNTLVDVVASTYLRMHRIEPGEACQCANDDYGRQTIEPVVPSVNLEQSRVDSAASGDGATVERFLGEHDTSAAPSAIQPGTYKYS